MTSRVVKRWRRRIDSSYVAIYYPWIAVEADKGDLVSMPPSGHGRGHVALRGRGRGAQGARQRAIVKGAQDVSIKLTEDHLGMLNNEGINCIRFAMGRGIRIWGARTCVSDPDWRYVNVRRLFIMLRRTLDQGFAWATFEPNAKPTWDHR